MGIALGQPLIGLVLGLIGGLGLGMVMRRRNLAEQLEKESQPTGG